MAASSGGWLESSGKLLRTATAPASPPKTLLGVGRGRGWRPHRSGHRCPAALGLGPAALCPRLGLAEVREPRGACALGPGCRPRKFRNDVVDPLAWSRGDGWPLSGTERPECHL